jgi:hypothetical protein
MTQTKIKALPDKRVPTRPTWDIWVENLWLMNNLIWYANPQNFDLVPLNFSGIFNFGSLGEWPKFPFLFQ